MSKEWLWWLGEFGLAAVVAIVAGFVTKDVPISILYGLFVGTVFFVLREHRRVVSQHEQIVSQMEDKAMNFPVTLSHRGDIDPFLRRIVYSEKDELLRLAREAEDGEIKLKSRLVSQVLPDYMRLARPGDKVVTTNSGVGWGTPQWDILRQICFDLVDKGVDFTRIFVEDTAATAEDKKRLRQEMEREKGRIKVRWMKESRLPPDARKNSVLIYDRYIAYGTYSKTVGTGIRQILEETTFSARRDELEKAREMAENLIKLSEEYK
ncbi:MAG: hypothetical protein V3W44_06745 [Dehalococcoidales bacterium]